MKRIPIKAAKELAERYKQRIVCIVAWDLDDPHAPGQTHVVTYGKNKQECEWAADLGNQIKTKVLHWPEAECHAEPARAKKPAEPPFHSHDADETCSEVCPANSGNPYSQFDCPHCGESRNGYENHHCPSPAELERRERVEQFFACGDQEERECETCGRTMVVPGKSGTGECSRCLDGN